MPDSVQDAEARAAAARARLLQTVNGLQDRLSPRTIAREAAESLVESGNQAARAGADTIREHPGKAAGIAALAIAFLARHRIAKAFRRPKRYPPPVKPRP